MLLFFLMTKNIKTKQHKTTKRQINKNQQQQQRTNTD